MIPLEEIRADLAAFADDDEEVVVDKQGHALFIRGGEEIGFKLATTTDGGVLVEIEDERVPYIQFLSHRLGRLDVLAERILSKRTRVPAYVDGGAELQSLSLGPLSGTAMALLREECADPPPFAARVIFVTADAGQGKTALLRQFQAQQAEDFLAGKGSFVFWHVDLQGRQLLRLSEALMGDLGELRVPGLWMPAVVRLLRHRVLVLAVDGFDELAAEQGSTDALGALALLVQQMRDSGTIIAASRRTFFDTDDYLRRAGLFGRVGAPDCEFDQLTLCEWGAAEAQAYLGDVRIEERKFSRPNQVYQRMVEELGDPEHPMLTRPFLLTQISRGLLLYGIEPADFLRGVDDPLKGVGTVIERFVEREVSEKWKQKDTGEPYLTKEQHLRLLSDVAEEMFRSQKPRLELEVVETIAALLLDEWTIEPMRRQQILDMVKMHVLLTPPPDGDHRFRSFDHPEFRDWFTAYAMKGQLDRLATGDQHDLGGLLSVAQMTDATARYAAALVHRDEDRVRRMVSRLTELVANEWRPTYLQLNVGTLVPYLIDGIQFHEGLEIQASAVYSSVVLEGKKLRHVHFRNGSFVNSSFVHADWRDVVFEQCNLGEITLDRDGKYKDVVIRESHIDRVSVMVGDEEEVREYAPDRIDAVLVGLGIAVGSGDREEAHPAETMVEGETRKDVNRVLRTFRRTTILPESLLERRFHRSIGRIRDEILPLMERHGVVEQRIWRGRGTQRAWALTRSLEDIQRADGNERDAMGEFWSAVDDLDRP